MEDAIVKYAFTYGPLMIFFFAVFYAIYRSSPVVITIFRELIAALNSSSAALNNSTSALNNNSEAMNRHYESMQALRDIFDQLRKHINSFECPHLADNPAKNVAKKQLRRNRLQKKD